MTALFYELFKPVNRSVALTPRFQSRRMRDSGFCLRVQLAPFVVLGGEPHSSVFTGSVAGVGLHVSPKCMARPTKIGLVFGSGNLLNGCLILRSSFLPRFLGVFMVIAGLPFLIFLLPVGKNLSPFAVAPAALGEGLLLVWLLVKGVNAQKWTEQAIQAAAQEPH